MMIAGSQGRISDSLGLVLPDCSRLMLNAGMMAHPCAAPSCSSLGPRQGWRIPCLLGLIASLGMLPASGAESTVPPAVSQFVKTHCADCHQGPDAEAGFDLTALSTNLSDPNVQRRWVRIFDRVHDGEMPPPAAGKLPEQSAQTFLKSSGDWLRNHQRAQQAELGRVLGRRLTKRELERSLQSLLGIDIPLADQLPDEPRPPGAFTTMASGQSMSHFQLERHLAVVDVALDEAYRRAFSQSDRYDRQFDAQGVARTDTRRRNREPEMRDGLAVIWSSGLIFYGRIPATTAPEDGWYRFTVTASGLKPPTTGGVWCTVRSGLCVSSAPLLSWVGSFEATPEPQTWTFEAWLPRRHMLEIRPGDITLKRGRFDGGQVGVGEGEPQNVPGVAFHGLTMERIHRGPDDDTIRQMLFGKLVQQDDSRREPYRLASASPHEDADRLIAAFARRAFRRPQSADEVAPYQQMVRTALDDGQDLAAALRVGYRSILCSPRFLYLTENPGPLDDHAIAARLSYFLTGNTPDEPLSQLADAGRLRNSDVLRGEVQRLLAGQGGRRFIEDFAAEWLDLDQIDFTEPDGKLFPDFDSIVQNGMLNETRTFLERMLGENRSVTQLITSDDTFLHSRLARFYGIDGVTGDELRPVSLQPEHRRGGVLTQGAILKVTANGSNTSPVVRGVWISERLLGDMIPPPPDNVPAIEPDIRGTTTIREMLEKHRSQEACASCHVKIDPPGFALENFDPAGRWRERYVHLINGRRETGAKIDASYSLRDGREFRNIDDFRQLIVADPRRLAHNVTEKLLVYGTGAPISFADREEVEKIAVASADDNYGFRTLVERVVLSPLFLSK
jgi:hypothetical protein